MNRKQLTDVVSQKTGYTKSAVDEVIVAVLAAVKKSVQSGDTVCLEGFGSFKKASKKSRKYTLPTGKVVKAPAKKVVKFTAGKDFATKVNKATSKSKKSK